jgi:CheY-like chemotaxis protein
MKQTIKYHNPDAMIIDFHISGSDRLEIVKTIKSDPSLHKIKVIVASGTNMYKESMRVGADYFIQKPFMPSELLNNLKLLTTQDGD